jgi:hypothetical protein
MTNTSRWKTAHEAALQWLEMAAHGLGGDSGGGLAAFDQLGPDGLPVFGAQLLAGDLAGSGALDGACALCCNCSIAGCHLGQERRIDAKVLRQLRAVSLVLLDVGFEVHIALAFAKVYCAFAKVATAKVKI